MNVACFFSNCLGFLQLGLISATRPQDFQVYKSYLELCEPLFVLRKQMNKCIKNTWIKCSLQHDKKKKKTANKEKIRNVPFTDSISSVIPKGSIPHSALDTLPFPTVCFPRVASHKATAEMWIQKSLHLTSPAQCSLPCFGFMHSADCSVFLLDVPWVH